MPSQQSVALVTGASSGISKDFAMRLLSEGYAVYGAARRTDRMADLASAGCAVIALDVTNDASMVAAVDQILSERGRIDVLINNAGYGQFGALEDVPINEGRRQIETNLIGAARLIQLCLPHMRARRCSGAGAYADTWPSSATPRRDSGRIRRLESSVT